MLRHFSRFQFHGVGEGCYCLRLCTFKPHDRPFEDFWSTKQMQRLLKTTLYSDFFCLAIYYSLTSRRRPGYTGSNIETNCCPKMKDCYCAIEAQRRINADARKENSFSMLFAILVFVKKCITIFCCFFYFIYLFILCVCGMCVCVGGGRGVPMAIKRKRRPMLSYKNDFAYFEQQKYKKNRFRFGI